MRHARPSPAHLRKPTIGVTLGDPAGIGPEVVAKSLRDAALRKRAHFLVIGDEAVFKIYFPRRPKECEFLSLEALSDKTFCIGKPSAATAQAALAYLKKSIDLLKEKHIEALVTAPLSKEATAQVLAQPFLGHTEFLAEAFGVNNFDMMFVGGPMRTVVVTRHLPLSQVSSALTTPKILSTIELTAHSLQSLFKIPRPKIAVCGLNPHAGEGGKMGREEIEKISPAIEQAQQKGIAVQGPFPADTIFCAGLRKDFDAIVAMYHDQGIIPVKTLAFERLVNMTIGLPFIRTSPAHGTAFAIAGKNIADPRSMKAALRLAAELSCR